MVEIINKNMYILVQSDSVVSNMSVDLSNAHMAQIYLHAGPEGCC